jgi:hypothetical protein
VRGEGFQRLTEFDESVLPRKPLLPPDTLSKEYILEFSNRGGKQHEDPRPVNFRGAPIRCRVAGCPKITRSLMGFCTEHNSKKKLWPKHKADWIGRLIPPSYTRNQCLTDAPAHFTIAEMLVKWMGKDPAKRARMDAFVTDLLDGPPDVRIAESIPDATTLQENLEIGVEGPDSPKGVVEKIRRAVDKHFPEREFDTTLLEGPTYRKKPLRRIPIRIVAAMLVTAYAAEESNRGDAWYIRKHGVKSEPKRASAYMPSVYYLLRRHTGASEGQARMSLKG